MSPTISIHLADEINKDLEQHKRRFRRLLCEPHRRNKSNQSVGAPGPPVAGVNRWSQSIKRLVRKCLMRKEAALDEILSSLLAISGRKWAPILHSNGRDNDAQCSCQMSHPNKHEHDGVQANGREANTIATSDICWLCPLHRPEEASLLPLSKHPDR